VTNLDEMLRRLIGEHIEVDTIAAAESCCIKADSGQIEQVIMNLVINARDAMAAGWKVDAGDRGDRNEPRQRRAAAGCASRHLRDTNDSRHRTRNERGNAGADFRTVFYHQGAGQRPTVDWVSPRCMES